MVQQITIFPNDEDELRQAFEQICLVQILEYIYAPEGIGEFGRVSEVQHKQNRTLFSHTAPDQEPRAH